MKKKLYMLIGAIVILAALFGIYLFMTSSAPDEPETENTDIVMEDLGTQIVKADYVKSFSLKNSQINLNFNKKGNSWYIDGYDNSFNASAIAGMASVFTSLYADSVIEENAEDMAKYGLAEPSAVASNDDVTINVGTITTDNKYYYVNLNDSNTVYMVNSARLNALLYGFNDIIDKSLPKIDTNSVQEISVDFSDESDKRDIVIKYDKDNPIAKEYSEKNGLATLVMEKPVSNILVYPYNLQSSILKNSDSINIKDLADIKPVDLTQYGLDNPICTIHLADNDNSINIKVGNVVTNDDDTRTAYVMVNGRPEVFTMDYRAIKPFIDAKIADFVEKFVSLYQRSKVKSISIEGSSNYDIQFKSEGENDFRDIDGVSKDYRNTYINNKLVDKETFTDFYELIVGISFDEIMDRTEPESNPEIIITFNLMDGSKEVDKYYNYNDSFYVVNKGEGSSMLVSKQTVRKVLSEAERLSKE